MERVQKERSRRRRGSEESETPTSRDLSRKRAEVTDRADDVLDEIEEALEENAEEAESSLIDQVVEILEALDTPQARRLLEHPDDAMFTGLVDVLRELGYTACELAAEATLENRQSCGCGHFLFCPF